MEIPKLKHPRRVFYFTVAMACILLFVARFVLLPLFYGTPIPPVRGMLDQILGDLLVTVLAATAIGTVLFWLVPPAQNIATMEVVPAYERGNVLDRARVDTAIWWFRGGLARYTRAVTIPDLAQRARASNLTKTIVIQILDPTDMEACRSYAEYRRAVRTGRGDANWTADRVRNELYATILSCCAWKHQEPLLDITVALRGAVSLFRVDLSSSLMIMTKEDPQEPALRSDAGTFFYNAFHEDLRLSLAQSRELSNTVPSITLADVSTGKARELFQSLGIDSEDLTEADLQCIVDIAKSAENPYA